MKKIIIRFFIIIAILIPIAAMAHYAVFPQTTQCILIGLSDFQNHQGIYFPPETDVATQARVTDFLGEGRTRIQSLFGRRMGSPVIIYCSTEDEFEKYGAKRSSPAVTQLSIFGEYVVINGTKSDGDVMAHEMCHAQLQSEIGWYNRFFKIPTWFDEGLAMQVDKRLEYSEDSLTAAVSKGARLPEITKMTTVGTFNIGSEDEVWMNYAAAKHEIAKWYSKEKLTRFLTMINEGKTFNEAYKQ